MPSTVKPSMIAIGYTALGHVEMQLPRGNDFARFTLEEALYFAQSLQEVVAFMDADLKAEKN